MRALIAPFLVACTTVMAAPGRHHEPALGLFVQLPRGASPRVVERTLTITAAGRPKVTITVGETAEARGSGRRGGHTWRQLADEVRYTIFVPKRQATCAADAVDEAGTRFAVAICESVELTPAPRRPNVVISVDGAGALDRAAVERGVQARADEVLACWLAALGENPSHSEGIIELVHHSRPAGDGASHTGVDLGAQLFTTDATALRTCVAGALETVPVALAPSARVKVSVDCLLK